MSKWDYYALEMSLLYRSAIRGHFSSFMCVSGHPIVAFVSKPAEKSHVVAISSKESVQHLRRQLLIAGLCVVLVNIFKAIFKEESPEGYGGVGILQAILPNAEEKSFDSSLPLLHIYL